MALRYVLVEALACGRGLAGVKTRRKLVRLRDVGVMFFHRLWHDTLQNKKKSKVVQKFVQQVTTQVKNMGAQQKVRSPNTALFVVVLTGLFETISDGIAVLCVT